MHGHGRNNRPDVADLHLGETRMGGIYPHRFKGEIQVGVYRNV